MVPTPASPTSLLWAHQLKREHAFLLARMKTIEDKNVATEQRDDTLHKRIEATEKDLKEYKEHVQTKQQEKEKDSDRAEKATLDREQKRRDDRISVMESKLDSLKNTVEDLGARNERCIFTLYTALMTQTSRQEDIFTQLRNLRTDLTEVRGELEGTSLAGKLGSGGFRDLWKLFNSIEKLDKGDTEEDLEPQQTLRRKNDSADTVVLARRVDALDAQRTEDNAIMNALRQRVHELEQALKRLNCEKVKNLQAQSETKNEIILTPSPAKPLSQVTTEIEATSSTPSPHHATMSSPLQEYAMRNEAKYGHQEKDTKIIMPMMNESVAKATLKGTRIAQNLSWKIQPNATRKRKALTPVPVTARETRSKTRLSNRVTKQQISPTNGQTKVYDKGPVCKDSQPSRERRLLEERHHMQQQPKKRRQIIQLCELEEPD